MSDAQEPGLPEPVAGEVPDLKDRRALEDVWERLEAARPAPAVSTGERAAMWAAIAAATQESSAVPESPSTARPTTAAPTTAAPSLPRPVPSPAWARRTRTTRALAGLAAAALVAVVGLVGRPGPWQEVAVPRGRQETVTLPDGSRVALEAGSVLRYRRDFRGWFGRSDARQTELEGSAFFEVTRDGRPFTVETYNAVVRVLGTSFSVQARGAEATGTAVAVVEGRVEVRGEADALALGVGERSVVTHGSAGPAAASSVPVDRVAPWRTGGFVAIDEPLATIVGTLGRRYDVGIALDPSVPAERRATLYLPEASLDRVLTDLAMVQGLVVERRRDGYALRLR